MIQPQNGILCQCQKIIKKGLMYWYGKISKLSWQKVKGLHNILMLEEKMKQKRNTCIGLICVKKIYLIG